MAVDPLNGGFDERTGRDGARVVKGFTVKRHTARNSLAGCLFWRRPHWPAHNPWTFLRRGAGASGTGLGSREAGSGCTTTSARRVSCSMSTSRSSPQGVITGGVDDVAKYGSLAEYTLNVDTQKLGL